MRPVVCLVTDRNKYGVNWKDELIERVRLAAVAGVHLIQVRERGLNDNELLELVSQCVKAVINTSCRVLVNDRFDIALAACAHGVHLPSDGIAPSRLRAYAPKDFIIGRSVHSEEEAKDIDSNGGVDYLLCGTIYPSQSKPGVTAAGISLLEVVSKAVILPILAIGGVSKENIQELAANGASGFAGISIFSGPVKDFTKTVHQTRLIFDSIQRVL